ncbi:enoyl-CoA hydratase/isomerase-like protein [Paraburkholderia caballeronis]|nr:enoyl-CoA hydratase/isomerase-like protein [Paraburkholderia caballeronis]TDV15897.1 enoyl-CoA hydratase/isomerase-like protein [Paraburkholderia caballeronis]TDV25158.1 enoyl-CoA hydratase/isomerase-like protein [Paraburkholderia caballeronis]
MMTESWGEHERIEPDGRVATIALDRPTRRNALDAPAAHALTDAFARFEAKPDWHVAVLFGAGGHFCAGADLSADGDDALGPTRMTLTKPTIAAVSGYAVAGGLELALMCDMRVVDEDAVPGVFRRRIGIPLIDGGAVRLPRLIGCRARST